MEQPGTGSLALVVRNPPWGRRAARADVDVALAAAAMEFRLEVYLLGAALLQIAAERDSSEALLPAGYRAWSALPELSEVEFFGEREWLERCERASIRLLLPVQSLSAEAMQSGWRRCQHVWVL